MALTTTNPCIKIATVSKKKGGKVMFMIKMNGVNHKEIQLNRDIIREITSADGRFVGHRLY